MSERKGRLADAIEELRGELIEAVKRGREPNDFPLQIESIDLELGVELISEIDADGRVKFKAWVVEAELGAGGSKARATTHYVRVSFKPAPGTDTFVSSGPMPAPRR